MHGKAVPLLHAAGGFVCVHPIAYLKPISFLSNSYFGFAVATQQKNTMMAGEMKYQDVNK